MRETDAEQWRRDLRPLLDAYRAMEPVKTLLSAMQAQNAFVAGPWNSLAFQDAFMAVVIRDPICDRFAPQRTYTYRLLKGYMQELERVDAELSDALVEEIAEFVAAPSGLAADMTIAADAMHHVTYRIPKEHAATSTDMTVTCRVASVFNEVGLKIWEAGWFLAEYVLAHRELFEGRNILELGAGVGFTGITLAKCIRARHLVMSDYAPKVMLNLRYNAEINSEAYQCPVDVQVLDWETWDPSVDHVQSGSRPEILLAGDCVYDVAVFPDLVRLLQSFLGDEDAQDHPRIAIFAATIRNQLTFQSFLSILKKHRISFEDITDSSIKQMGSKPLFPYDNREHIRLCKLFRTGKMAS